MARLHCPVALLNFASRACKAPEITGLSMKLFPAEQARLVHLLVERVDIGEEALDIRLRADGLPGLAREFGAGRMAA